MPDGDEDDVTWIGCSRTADLPLAATDSSEQRCRECGAAVWVANGLREELTMLRPDSELRIACLQCLPDDGETRDLQLAPGQIRSMLAQGIPPVEMAAVFALVELTQSSLPDDPKVVAARTEIAAFPNGKLARDFKNRFAKWVAVIDTTASGRVN